MLLEQTEFRKEGVSMINDFEDFCTGCRCYLAAICSAFQTTWAKAECSDSKLITMTIREWLNGYDMSAKSITRAGCFGYCCLYNFRSLKAKIKKRCLSQYLCRFEKTTYFLVKHASYIAPQYYPFQNGVWISPNSF